MLISHLIIVLLRVMKISLRHVLMQLRFPGKASTTTSGNRNNLTNMLTQQGPGLDRQRKLSALLKEEAIAYVDVILRSDFRQ